ncbi:MAG: inositol monophosphatase family protein [Ilumatobacteraceae bacterium]
MSESDHQLAVRIADEAGRMLVELRSDLISQGIHYWDLKDEGDVAGHRFIAAAIKESRPGDVILSEEAADDRQRLTADRVWIIDPIDGTNEFAEPPRHDWAVHIALWERGDLVAAAVALPAVGLTLGTSPAPSLPDRTRLRPLLVTSRSRNPYCAVVVAQALGCDVARLGSAGAKAMAVVMGEADIYVHDGGMYQWDSAAPSAVARAAGLHVSRIDGSPLDYNQSSLWLPDLLICRPELAEPAIAALTS